jgi:HEAT repeat protein
MATPEQRLLELKRSELLSSDFPKRQHLTHAQWACLSDEQRIESRSAQTTAIRRAQNTSVLVNVIKEISGSKQQSAVPLLATLWSDCALEPVRQAAGHALRNIGSREARTALESLIEDADHLSVFLAIQAVFDSDPATAFDRFGPYFDPQRVSQPGGNVIPYEVLGTFGPVWNARTVTRESHWVMKEPRWFQQDERWMDLCVRLRRDKHLGHAARAVLRLVEPDRVRAKLSHARVQEGSRNVRRQSAAAGDLLARYRRGELEAVWAELRTHQAIDGDYRTEAIAVAQETMTLVARCADLLAERLAARGWIPLTGHLRSPPSGQGSRTMQEIEQFTGALLPPSLAAFWNCVGGIDFVWNYNSDAQAPDLLAGLEMTEMDPLLVFSPEQIADLLLEWKERRSSVDPELDDPWSLDLAPDYLHKANISGGAPYAIELPHLGADPIFINEGRGLPFVEYLRAAFRWGGFPRLERHAHRVAVRRFLSEMTKDLEPF